LQNLSGVFAREESGEALAKPPLEVFAREKTEYRIQESE
jgi:hypothetical protein